MLKILNYTPIVKGLCIGHVDVEVINKDYTLIIRRINHLEKEGRRWFNFPQYSETAEDGKYVYKHYVEYGNPDLNRKFFEVLSPEVKKYIEEHHIQTQIGLINTQNAKKEVPEYQSDIF